MIAYAIIPLDRVVNIVSQPTLLRRDNVSTDGSIALLNSDALHAEFLDRDNKINALTLQMFPVGSIYTTSANVNPSTFMGGEWALFDKEFINNKSLTLSEENYTLNTTNCSAVSGTLYYSGHFIELQITITPKVAITDTALEMFTFKMESIGTKSFRHSTIISHFSDSGNASISYSLTAAGKLSTNDVLVRGSSTASLATGYTPQFRILMPNTYGNMVDSFCDKFYWKRTA